MCLESCFFFQDQDGSCKHMSLTVCRSELQGDGPCSDPMLWDGGRRGEGRNILLLTGWVGSSLSSLYPAIPGITPEPMGSLSDYQVLVAVKGTSWISPISNLIQFDTGGSGLESLTNKSQKQLGEDAQSCTHLPTASFPVISGPMTLKGCLDPSAAGAWCCVWRGGCAE